jgi:WhiB family redox-sensing transcriptional regulator
MFAYSWAENDDEIEVTAAVTWEAAACRDGSSTLTALFFSDEIAEIEVAKAICTTCPLMVPCLRTALARREPVGVWGGELFADGVVIVKKRKRGRPPKVVAGMPSQPTFPQDDPSQRLVQSRHQRPECLEYATQRLKTA